MAKYLVTFTAPNGVKAYAAGTDSQGDYAYSFALSEATEYDWQADAMNACRERNDNDSYFLHDSAQSLMIPQGKIVWDYEKIV